MISFESESDFASDFRSSGLSPSSGRTSFAKAPQDPELVAMLLMGIGRISFAIDSSSLQHDFSHVSAFPVLSTFALKRFSDIRGIVVNIGAAVGLDDEAVTLTNSSVFFEVSVISLKVVVGREVAGFEVVVGEEIIGCGLFEVVFIIGFKVVVGNEVIVCEMVGDVIVSGFIVVGGNVTTGA